MRRPCSSVMSTMSAVTGARRNASSPTASAIAFRTEPYPAPTGGSPTPRAPTGASGSARPTTAVCIVDVGACPQPETGQQPRRAPGEGMNIVRQLVTVVLAAELDGAVRRLRERQPA